MEKKRLLVIGGGAAGFFCAVNAAAQNPELEVTLAEKSGKLLSKVKVSGGGRCNVTHACFHISEMIKKYPRGGQFLKKAFPVFFTTDTMAWFEKRGVPLKTEADGRVFPRSDSSETIIGCLLKEAARYGVRILLNAEIGRVEKWGDATPRFQAATRDGTVLQADYLCIACGGYHKSGQYHWISSLGHRFVDPVPSLFTFNIPANPLSDLMGIAVEPAQVKIAGTKFSSTGPILVTHWGISGPAVLKLSAFAARELSQRNYDFQVLVNWLPGLHEQSVLEKLRILRQELASRKIHNKNPFHLPQRLWEYHLEQCEIDPQSRWADLPAKQQNQLAKQLCNGLFAVQGKTTFKEEFVTAGGISLDEVDPRTMESRIHPGLFFAGEILDVDGITGGFNFQHAWTSGWIAASAVGSALKTSMQVPPPAPGKD